MSYLIMTRLVHLQSRVEILLTTSLKDVDVSQFALIARKIDTPEPLSRLAIPTRPLDWNEISPDLSDKVKEKFRLREPTSDPTALSNLFFALSSRLSLGSRVSAARLGKASDEDLILYQRLQAIFKEKQFYEQIHWPNCVMAYRLWTLARSVWYLNRIGEMRQARILGIVDRGHQVGVKSLWEEYLAKTEFKERPGLSDLAIARDTVRCIFDHRVDESKIQRRIDRVQVRLVQASAPDYQFREECEQDRDPVYDRLPDSMRRRPKTLDNQTNWKYIE